MHPDAPVIIRSPCILQPQRRQVEKTSVGSFRNNGFSQFLPIQIEKHMDFRMKVLLKHFAVVKYEKRFKILNLILNKIIF